MQTEQLKKEYRDQILSNYRLRCIIAVDIRTDQSTIKRQTEKNSYKLLREDFLKSLRKHLNIPKSVELTELIEMEVHPLA